jgi:tetrahydromethanopterin S-methyltransferase subunit B
MRFLFGLFAVGFVVLALIALLIGATFPLLSREFIP